MWSAPQKEEVLKGRKLSPEAAAEQLTIRKYFQKTGKLLNKHLQSIMDADLSGNHVGGSTVHVEADLVAWTLLYYTRP